MTFREPNEEFFNYAMLENVEIPTFYKKRQVIVLVAMIILGIGIAGMVTGFETAATSITDGANVLIETEFTDIIDDGQ